MLETSSAGVDPENITDRVEFAAALTTLRERAGLTVRDLAKHAAVPTATVSGYLSGRHLPSPSQPEALIAVLTACGVVSARHHEAWLAVLRRVRQSPGRRPAAGPSPYPGLVSFQSEDAPYYFGRAELVADIRARLRATREGRRDDRIMVVTGPSGSGKSSVLRAGVIPQVAALGVRALIVTPGEDPIADLARVCAEHSGLPAHDVRALLESGNDLSALLPVDEQVLLVVDQAEEMFAACPDATRRATFLSAVHRLAVGTDPAGHQTLIAVLALRADFYAAAADEPVLLPALRHAQVVVGSMTRAELTEAIVGPAAAVGLHVDDALVQTLLDDLAPRDRPGSAHDRGALPLLAHALHATWLVSRRGRMTVDDYIATGGIAGAVERTAETVWADLDDESRELVRRIFLRLVFVDDESAVTRRRVRLDELRGLGEDAVPAGERTAATAVIEMFADARLLTLRTDTVEISHEALIGAWQRLHQWIDADRSALRVHRQISDAARTWQRADRDESYLLRSGRLAMVEDLLVSGRVSLNGIEQEFVDASTQQQEERRESQRRQRLRLRISLAAVAVLAVVASVLAVTALRSEASANERAAETSAARDDAQSRELAISADRMRDSDPALAAQLSLIAYRISETVDARSALLDSTARSLPTRIAAQEGPTFVAVNRARALMAVTEAQSGAVTLWSIKDSTAPVRLAEVASAQPEVQQFSVAISSDGRQLAAGDAGGLVERWDISDPAHPRSLPGPGVVFPSGVLALAYSPDGQRLAAGGEGGSVLWWDVSGSESATELPKMPGAALVTALAWAPNGNSLWVGDGDGTIALADTGVGAGTSAGAGTSVGAGTSAGADAKVGAAGGGGGAALAATGAAPATLSAGPASIAAVAVSPDGDTVAVGNKRGELHVWRHDSTGQWIADEPDVPVRLAGWLDSISFAPDGSDIALGGTGNEMRVVDARTLAQKDSVSTPGPVTAAVYAQDGTLISGSSDGFARLWPVPGPSIASVGDIVVGVDMPTPNRLIVGASAKVGALLSYDVSDRNRPQKYSAAPGSDDIRLAGVVAVSPDGALVAIGASDGRVQLWDTSDPDKPRAIGVPFPGAPDYVNSMDISADGRTLVIGSDASVVDLWDIADPTHPTQLFESPDAGGQVTSVRFQPEGQLLAAATTGGNVRLWNVSDVAHPTQVADLDGPEGYLWTAAWSHDGTLLAAGGSAREVQLWDVHDSSHITAVGSPITGPANDIGSLAFDPTGPRLAAATYGGIVWMWDVSVPGNPQRLVKARGASGVLYTLAWSPDGTQIVAGGSAQQVWTWIANADSAAAEICATSGVGITEGEWKLYVQERAYQPPCG